MTEKPHPRLGVAAVISNAEGKFLVGKRKGGLGAETSEGKGESRVRNAESIIIDQNDIWRNYYMELLTKRGNIQAHWGFRAVTLSMMRNPGAVPRVMEPEKCEGWEWKSSNELKQIAEAAKPDSCGERLFLPLVNLIKKVLSEDMDLNAYIMSR
ncbi:hypothetical protein M441DRAFT_48253 [Trichoderma asperellum CBS 433.97]|uniref:Nudix hydrolase domain-containing protein n=1 Tax=Trichoderma asperellum (strain ATCC 204424 / CBS 433.97 / NBRC 101777) TaxID=1042311 RepID=A0A2T3Z6I8_TRIA4|nr:hypothetical protein M441DRAFT_48253 [Trichoderma asperellum CBS 433.97]PTB40412.1 hypothetical protein M441DRAFT_48253 [Trichoderma asperellum CBS 433.97]